MGALWIDGVPLEDDWHYDVQVEFHLGTPGSAMEYSWKLYREENQNAILVDRLDDSNGFFVNDYDFFRCQKLAETLCGEHTSAILGKMSIQTSSGREG